MENRHFGSYCPDDKVQVEVVMTDGKPLTSYSGRMHGFEPGETAMVEIYVGGRRFIILAGVAARAYGHHEPCIIVQSDVSLETKPVAINSVMVKFDAKGEEIWRKTSGRS